MYANSPLEFLLSAELLVAALDLALDGLVERMHVLVPLQPPCRHALPAYVAHNLLRTPVPLGADTESNDHGCAVWPNKMLHWKYSISCIRVVSLFSLKGLYDNEFLNFKGAILF